MKRRSFQALKAEIEGARTKRERALAFYNLALFHDNNSREPEAIPNYEAALRLGLIGETRAKAFAWLASSLHKTGCPGRARVALENARAQTRDRGLKKFLDGLERRIRRA